MNKMFLITNILLLLSSIVINQGRIIKEQTPPFDRLISPRKYNLYQQQEQQEQQEEQQDHSNKFQHVQQQRRQVLTTMNKISEDISSINTQEGEEPVTVVDRNGLNDNNNDRNDTSSSPLNPLVMQDDNNNNSLKMIMSITFNYYIEVKNRNEDSKSILTEIDKLMEEHREETMNHLTELLRHDSTDEKIEVLNVTSMKVGLCQPHNQTNSCYHINSTVTISHDGTYNESVLRRAAIRELEDIFETINSSPSSSSSSSHAHVNQTQEDDDNSNDGKSSSITLTYVGPIVESTIVNIRLDHVYPREMNDEEKDTFVMILKEFLQVRVVKKKFWITSVRVLDQDVSLMGRTRRTLRRRRRFIMEGVDNRTATNDVRVQVNAEFRPPPFDAVFPQLVEDAINGVDNNNDSSSSNSKPNENGGDLAQELGESNQGYFGAIRDVTASTVDTDSSTTTASGVGGLPTVNGALGSDGFSLLSDQDEKRPMETYFLVSVAMVGLILALGVSFVIYRKGLTLPTPKNGKSAAGAACGDNHHHHHHEEEEDGFVDDQHHHGAVTLSDRSSNASATNNSTVIVDNDGASMPTVQHGQRRAPGHAGTASSRSSSFAASAGAVIVHRVSSSSSEDERDHYEDEPVENHHDEEKMEEEDDDKSKLNKSQRAQQLSRLDERIASKVAKRSTTTTTRSNGKDESDKLIKNADSAANSSSSKRRLDERIAAKVARRSGTSKSEDDVPNDDDNDDVNVVTGHRKRGSYARKLTRSRMKMDESFIRSGKRSFTDRRRNSNNNNNNNNTDDTTTPDNTLRPGAIAVNGNDEDNTTTDMSRRQYRKKSRPVTTVEQSPTFGSERGPDNQHIVDDNDNDDVISVDDDASSRATATTSSTDSTNQNNDQQSTKLKMKLRGVEESPTRGSERIPTELERDSNKEPPTTPQLAPITTIVEEGEDGISTELQVFSPLDEPPPPPSATSRPLPFAEKTLFVGSEHSFHFKEKKDDAATTGVVKQHTRNMTEETVEAEIDSPLRD